MDIEDLDTSNELLIKAASRIQHNFRVFRGRKLLRARIRSRHLDLLSLIYNILKYFLINFLRFFSFFRIYLHIYFVEKFKTDKLI